MHYNRINIITCMHNKHISVPHEVQNLRARAEDFPNNEKWTTC